MLVTYYYYDPILSCCISQVDDVHWLYPNITSSAIIYRIQQNFCGFHGFSANRKSFPLESFAVYST